MGRKRYSDPCFCCLFLLFLTPVSLFLFRLFPPVSDDPQERRLLRAFRAASRRRRARILAFAETESVDRPASLRRA